MVFWRRDKKDALDERDWRFLGVVGKNIAEGDTLSTDNYILLYQTLKAGELDKAMALTKGFLENLLAACEENLDEARTAPYPEDVREELIAAYTANIKNIRMFLDK